MAEPDRIPFSKVKAYDHITFDNGIYATGTVLACVGTYNGKRLIQFQEDGYAITRYLSYAAHRSVILNSRVDRQKSAP